MLGSTGPVERKVVAGSATAFVVANVMGWVYTAWPGVPDALSTPLAVFVASSITAGLAWVAGFVAKHTPRTDVDAVGSRHGS